MIDCADGYRLSASIIVHGSNIIYAMINSTFSYRSSFFRGCITVASDYMTLRGIEWRQLHVIEKNNIIYSCAYLTVCGDSLVVAEVDSKVRLYTPSKDKLMDVDELDLVFGHSLYGICGLSDGSLVVIGDAQKSYSDDPLKSAVVKFKSKGIILI